MSYIGNQVTTTAFVTDTFSGNGLTTAFTMSVAPAGTTSMIVAITGVLQDPSTYSVVGTTLTFTAAPPTGTGNISVRYLGIPASGVTTTAYRTVTEFTATAGQTTFTPPSYTVGFLNVYMNGVLLGSADYTATNGTTVVLASGAVAGALVTTESFYVSSVLNALPNTGGTLSGNLAVVGTVTSTGGHASNGANPAGTSIIAGRVDSSNEGGQLDLCRSTDNTSAWAIDVYGSTSTPSFRILDNVAGSARMTIDSAGVITGSAGNVQLISGTAQASTSGTAITFSSIPNWVKRITVMFQGVSTNGTSNPLVQIGSGSVTTSGYSGSAALPNQGGATAGSTYTTGFGLPFSSATNALYGTMTISLLGSNIYVSSHCIATNTTGAASVGGGSVTLGGALDRVVITTVNGTDTFDAGSINIMYE